MESSTIIIIICLQVSQFTKEDHQVGCLVCGIQSAPQGHQLSRTGPRSSSMREKVQHEWRRTFVSPTEFVYVVHILSLVDKGNHIKQHGGIVY